MEFEKKVWMLPKIHQKSKYNFWEDEYISKKLLVAHLDSNFEGASRNRIFIENSLNWIHGLLSETRYPKLLDLGCGPGLYAEGLARRGYLVSGVDISKRSIAYAKASATKHKLNISYQCDNYVSMNITERYDVITMIYCDYGALDKTDRQIVMKKIYHSLREGGVFLFDVFTDKKYFAFEEYQTWEFVEKDGFWHPNAHSVIQRNKKYPGLVSLEQSIILSKEEYQNYYIWHTYFTKDDLIAEVTQAGFKVKKIYDNVAGKKYTGEEETMCVILEK